ncbi:MAG: methionyl-tRNA formyltransferase [bacterium]|nr:methionyl-tRNA formyltransferase [bacterium]
MSNQKSKIKNQSLSGASIRTIFMGTPDFAVPSLDAILTLPYLEIVGVFTQPDRPVGRNQELRESAIKKTATAKGLPVFTPHRLRDADTIELIKTLAPDLIVVVAYGQIVPQAILDLPRFRTINVHGSLLPKYRGASPIQAAIAAGESETGVTIMLMDALLDHGPILTQEKIPIAPRETGESLFEKMAPIGAALLAKTISAWIAGDLQPIEQNHTLATATKILTRENGRIDWNESATTLERKVRAYHPWPGTWTVWNRTGKPLRLNIIQSRVNEFNDARTPGAVFKTPTGCAVACAEGALELEIVKLEGKKETPLSEFLNGYPDFVGSVLDK